MDYTQVNYITEDNLNELKKIQIDARYCYWGDIEWYENEIRLDKKVGVNIIAPEQIVIVDNQKKKLHLCFFKHTGGNHSYLKVIESYDMEDKLYSFLSKHNLKAKDLYKLEEKEVLSKSHVSTQILDIIKKNAKPVKKAEVETSIIYDIREVYNSLMEKGIPRENIKKSIFVLFPQLLQERDVFTPRSYKLHDIQNRLVDLQSKKIDIHKEIDSLYLSEEKNEERIKELQDELLQQICSGIYQINNHSKA